MLNWFKKTEKYSDQQRCMIDEIRNSLNSSAQINVNEKTALNLVDVFACIRAISETLGSLPFPVYRRKDRGKERLREHPVHRILNISPDGEIPAMAWREAGLGHLLGWGNWYNEIEKTRGGEVMNLHLLLPNKVTPERSKSGKVQYKCVGSYVPIPADRMLHVSGLGFDGLVGYSPIKMGKSAIELSMQTEQFGLNWFRNGSRGQGIITSPNKISPESAKNLRESIEAVHRGTENAHRFMILEEGMSVQQIGVPPDDAQFLGTRQFQLTEICRLFRISPVLVQDLSRSTFSNNEQEMLSFVVHTLRPWCRRIENVINWKLFGDEPDLFAEHLIDGLLRGDKAIRDKSYATGRQWGWYSANDVLELENQNGIGEQGDQYLVPANMINAKKVLDLNYFPAKPTETELPDSIPSPDSDDEEKEEDIVKKIDKDIPTEDVVKASLYCLKDNVDRMIRREIEAIKNSAKKPKEFLSLMDSFYSTHKEFSQRAINPSLKTYEAISGKTGLSPVILNSLIDQPIEELLELSGKVSATDLPKEIQKWSDSRINKGNEIIQALEAYEQN